MSGLSLRERIDLAFSVISVVSRRSGSSSSFAQSSSNPSRACASYRLDVFDFDARPRVTMGLLTVGNGSLAAGTVQWIAETACNSELGMRQHESRPRFHHRLIRCCGLTTDGLRTKRYASF